jgi:hypothetical protein
MHRTNILLHIKQKFQYVQVQLLYFGKVSFCEEPAIAVQSPIKPFNATIIKKENAHTGWEKKFVLNTFYEFW